MKKLSYCLLLISFWCIKTNINSQDIAFVSNGSEKVIEKIRNTFPECTQPDNVKFKILNSKDLLFTWDGPKASKTGIRYQLRYRELINENPTEWSIIDAYSDNFYIFSNILAERKYEFHIRKICDGENKVYSLVSDWVEIFKKVVISLNDSGDNPCDPLFGQLTPNGNGVYGLKVNATPATNCGDRYKYRYKECSSNSEWKEGFILDGDSATITILPSNGICKAQIRLIWGGCGSVYQNYCPWFDINGTVVSDYNNDIDLTCDGSQTIPPPSGTDLLQHLSTGDRIKSGGIPIIVDTVIASHGNGVFTGEGVAILPFPNLKAKVTFNHITINTNKEVFNGSIFGKNSLFSNLPYKNVGAPKSGVTSCIKSDDSEWDENGNHKQTGTKIDPYGFDQDGKFKLSPPYNTWEEGDPTDTIYDPNGFDSNGNHINTGTKFNDNGCSRDSIDKEGNSPCDPGKDGPYYWKRGDTTSVSGEAFYKDIADSLQYSIRDIIEQIIADEENLLTEIMINCTKIKDSINVNINALGLSSNRNYIAGSGDKFINSGMSENFNTEPKTLAQGGIVRTNQKFIDLETNHVKLYECDKEAVDKDNYITMVKSFLDKEDSIKNVLALLIKNFSKEEVDIYKDPSEFEKWLKEHIQEIIQQRRDGLGFIEPKQNILFSNPCKKSFISDQEFYIPYADLNPFPKEFDLDYILSFQYSQGNKYINGKHRVHYFQNIINERESSSNLLVNEEFNLPIVWKREVLGKNHSLYIDNLELNPITGGKFDIYYIFPLTTNNDSLVFEASGVVFGPGGVIGSARLHLLHDFNVKLFKSAVLKIKGTSPSTFVEFDCDGFSGAGMEAEIEFCREYLTPLTPTLEIDPDITKKVKASIKVEMQSWTDFFTKVDIQPFALTSFQDVRWTIEDAILDFSDLKSDSITFPNGYKNGEAENGIPTPAWKGFYMKQLSAYLPKEFSSNGNPYKLGVKDVIIDDMGFTGKGFAEGNIVSISEGNLSGWAFSIKRVEIGVISNNLTSASFGGKLNIPIFTSSNPNNNGPEDDCFAYTAGWKANKNFDFLITTTGSVKAELWLASVILDKSTKISIKYENSVFYNEANLTGSIKIGGNLAEKFSVPSINFERLVFDNQKPDYFQSVAKFGVNDTFGVKFHGYELSIRNPSIKFIEGKPSILFSTYISFDTKTIKLTGAADFAVIGKLSQESPQQWSFDRIQPSFVSLDANIKGNKIHGSVEFFDKDKGSAAGFGEGWQGMLQANFAKLDVNVAVFGVFGKMEKEDGSEYKYMMVDAVAEFPGIPLGAIKLKGIAGGFYCNMHRDTAANIEFKPPGGKPALGQSLSGVIYKPNDIYSFGFKIGVILTAPKEEVFNGNANFEMTFYDGGGISDIYFFGNARFLTPINKGASLAYTKGAPPPGSAQIAANLELHWTPGNFTGELEVYMNLLNGSITGGGAGGRMGMASINFTPGAWKIWIGTPIDPFSVNIFGVHATSYLDIGNTLPPLKALPPKVGQMLGGFKSTLSTSGAGGIMFGSTFGFNSGPKEFSIFFAEFNAEIGFDLSILKYSNLICAGSNSEIGINGWYAQGRMWGYMDGSVGIIIKRKHKDPKRIHILDLSMAAAMEGGFPNPFYARGAVGGEYKVLGIFKGKCNFQFELGEKCESIDEEYDENALNAIGQITPDNETKEVFSGANVTVEMQIPLNNRIEFVDDNNEIEIIEVKLNKDSCYIKMDSLVSIPFTVDIINNGNNIIFKPINFLPSKDTVDFLIWVDIYSNGVYESSEQKSLRFYTADELDFIPDENIKFSYPIKNMRNFYQKNSMRGEGYIMLNKGQPNISKQENEIFIASFVSKDFSVKTDAKLVGTDYFFTIPELPNNVNFVLNIERMTNNSKRQISVPQVICSIPFRTSIYNKFEDKIAAINSTISTSEMGFDLKSNFNTGEIFDPLEISGTNEIPNLINFYLRSKPGSSGNIGDGSGRQAIFIEQGLPPIERAAKYIYRPISFCSSTANFIENQLPFTYNQVFYISDSTNSKFNIGIKGRILNDDFSFRNKIQTILYKIMGQQGISRDDAILEFSSYCGDDMFDYLNSDFSNFTFKGSNLYIDVKYAIPGQTEVHGTITTTIPQ